MLNKSKETPGSRYSNICKCGGYKRIGSKRCMNCCRRKNHRGSGFGRNEKRKQRLKEDPGFRKRQNEMQKRSYWKKKKKVNNRCKCGKLISPESKFCQKHAPRNRFKIKKNEKMDRT